MQFAGKDFLKQPAPAGYKAGVGRGAVGFTTSAERGSAFPARSSSRSNAIESAEKSRFVDAEDEEAERIYDLVESKRRRKHKRVKLANGGSARAGGSSESLPFSAPSALTADAGKPSQDAQQPEEGSNELATVSMDEWAQLPEASDSTRWNKRLRESEQNTQRFYVAPGDRKAPEREQEHEREGERLDGNAEGEPRFGGIDGQIGEWMRPALETMIKQQPLNEAGYLRLAQLEKQNLQMKKARRIVEHGTIKVPNSENLWLASLDLHAGSSHECRQIVTKAVRALPQSEKLWLKAVELEPTNALKQQVVHEALTSCLTSERLWLIAAELEPSDAERLEVLGTAKEFVDTPAIWLSLAKYNMACLDEARKRFPGNKQIWFQSVTNDENLVQEGISSLPRDAWLEFVSSLPIENNRSLVNRLFAELKITLEESAKAGLPKEHLELAYRHMEPSESVYLQWAAINPEILDEAVTQIPGSDKLWIDFFLKRAKDDLSRWERVMSIAPSASPIVVQWIACLLQDVKGNDERVVAWLDAAGNLTPVLYLQYIKAKKRIAPDEVPDLIEKGLEKWPNLYRLYILKSEVAIEPEQRVEILRDALNRVDEKDRSHIWERIAEYEPKTTRRRAILAQALAKYPQSGELWLSRIRLEKQENKPVAHALAEALKNAPEHAPLWLEDMLAAPANQRKRRLAEAVRQSRGHPDVLVYGAKYFAATNNMSTAHEWLKRAGKTSDEAEQILNETNPFVNESK